MEIENRRSQIVANFGDVGLLCNNGSVKIRNLSLGEFCYHDGGVQKKRKLNGFLQ